MTEALENKKRGGTNPLRWLNENFESIFLVTGMLGIIFLITWQVAYRYIDGGSAGRTGPLYFCVDFLSGCAGSHQKA